MKTLSQKVYNAILLLFVIGLFGCGGGGGTNEGGGDNNGGGANEIPARTTSTEYLVHFAEDVGSQYKKLSDSPTLSIGNVPADTDFSRWAIETPGFFQALDDVSIYAFKSGTGNVIRHFKYDSNSDSYNYQRDYTVNGVPSDAKFGKFGASKGNFLYIQSKTDLKKFYLFIYDPQNENYYYDNSSYELANIPAEADLNRWGVETDILGFTGIYTLQKGSNNTIYKFNGDVFEPRSLKFANSKTVSDIPTTADFSDFAVAQFDFRMAFLEINTTEIICGREGERACKITERIPSCDAGLVEDFMTGKCVKE